MTYSVLLATLLPVLTLSAASRAVIEPSQPKWGDTIQLIYHSDAAGAKLHSRDNVVALVTIWYPENVEQKRVPMAPANGRLEASLAVPENASFLNCYFVTRDAYDGPASSMIWNRAGQPARDAWHESMTTPYLAADYRDRAAKELALYPDNWAVYRDIWFLSAKEADRAEIVRRDMALIAAGAPERPLGALYSLAYGHLLLNDEAKSREVLAEMVKRFPDALKTYWSLSSYEYESQVRHFSGDGPAQVRAWRLDYVQLHPATATARGDIDSAGAATLPAATLEAICRPWIAEEPRNPKPYMALAAALRRDPAHTAEALAYTETALTLLLEGELRLHGDVFGKITEFLLPSLFHSASELALATGKPLAALSYAKAAQSIGPQRRSEDCEAEARVWLALGHPSLAKAARRQSGERDSKTAPAFQGVALDGSAIDSAQLRGKIVVANFWFTGCGPCKAEIPDLNKLASEFAGRNVVFLAFSLDDDPALLQRFLKEFPFQYTIIPAADKIAERFGIKTYPSHVVIGAGGKIESMLEGGGENAAASLRTTITRLLD